MNLNPEQKIAGVLAPVFALRGENDLGAGDVSTLRDLVDWAAETGFRIVQILPINETGGDNSPYNAISSVALDVTTLDVSPAALPDLTNQASRNVLKEFDVAGLRDGAVDYAEVKKLKHTLLTKAYQRFVSQEEKLQTPRALEFAEFCTLQHAWLADYAFFRMLAERNGSERWNTWPTEHTSPTTAKDWLEALPARARKDFLQRRRYYQYVQWIAYGQWRELHTYCVEKGVALMGDVPFGVSYFSADVWADRESFVLDWSGGAPPETVFKSDPFTEKWGQNWGIPLYNWDLMRSNNFRWWRQRVRMVRELLDLFRIDHVLGCYRIYAFPWRPADNETFLPLTPEEAMGRTGGRLPGFQPRDDNSDENKRLNQKEGEELLRVLLEETGEFRLVGEDLGSVPDYVRPSLQGLKIAGFKIPQWEREWRETSGEWREEFIRPEYYERLSVATFATHDHAPIRSMWEAWTTSIRDNDSDAEASRVEMQRMMRYCGLPTDEGWPEFSPEIHRAMLETLFRSNSWQVIWMVTDLFGTTTRFNVPGAISAANWSNRLDVAVAKWTSDPDLGAQTKLLATLVADSGRSHLE